MMPIANQFNSTIVYRKNSIEQRLILIGILVVLIAACNPDQREEDDIPPPLYSQPQTVPINLQEGYSFNTVTGDSVQTLINSVGDTVKTGVPIPAAGRLINPEGKVVPVGKPKVVKASSNVHPISEKLIVIPVDENKLKKFTPGKDSSSFVLINSKGDTIPTGIPIPAKGKIVPCIEPRSIQALPMRMKDNTIFDIQYLDVDQGMSSSYVWSILEDNGGNLWFGTDAGGVTRYDGKSFTHYTEKEGLSDNSIRSILEDKSGNLWFGTYEGGVSRYDGKSFTHYTEKEG
ncbi:MAG: hypothetical protein KAQ62_26390, partial [Cyclobacteriaceae bacterium]|nr:hypothetical protein [Cyclobacteriaceae bacterium]